MAEMQLINPTKYQLNKSFWDIKHDYASYVAVCGALKTILCHS